MNRNNRTFKVISALKLQRSDGKLIAVPSPSAVQLESDRMAVLRLLGELQAQLPELRTAQIMVNACGIDLFYMEDSEMVQRLQSFAAGRKLP